MDKRLLILMAVALLGSSGFFAYRKLYYKPEGIRYTIKPSAVLKAGDSISYEDQTAGASRWKWDFGDGEFSVNQSGYHTFLAPGQYNVTLTAYGPFGMLKQHETMNVVARDILATTTAPGISGPESATAGIPASWQSTARADHYEWKVEGDPMLAHASQQGPSASFTFRNPGRRTLVLHTQNPDGVARYDVMVLAAEQPRPRPAVNASIPMPPHHAVHERPHHSQQPQHGNKLEDLGGPVEIKK